MTTHQHTGAPESSRTTGIYWLSRRVDQVFSYFLDNDVGCVPSPPRPRWDVLWGRHKGAASHSVRASFPPWAGLRGRPRFPNICFHPRAEGSAWLSGLAACHKYCFVKIITHPLSNSFGFICCPLLPSPWGMDISSPHPTSPLLCGWSNDILNFETVIWVCIFVKAAVWLYPFTAMYSYGHYSFFVQFAFMCSPAVHWTTT